MKFLKNRKATIANAIFLIMAMSASMAFLPNTDAHTPIWTFDSYAYLTVQPSPVGVGQTVHVVMWIDGPLPGATVTNDIRRHDYKLTITGPEGQVETKNWPVVDDTTNPQQTYTWGTGPTSYNGDIFKAASTTVTLDVQQDPIPAAPDSYPYQLNTGPDPSKGKTPTGSR